MNQTTVFLTHHCLDAPTFIYKTTTIPYPSLCYPHRIRCSSFKAYLLHSFIQRSSYPLRTRTPSSYARRSEDTLWRCIRWHCTLRVHLLLEDLTDRNVSKKHWQHCRQVSLRKPQIRAMNPCRRSVTLIPEYLGEHTRDIRTINRTLCHFSCLIPT
jgi:hypothetical protein